MLHAADGWSNNAIANEVGVTRTSVIEWRRRFAAEGLDALGTVRPGRGRPRSISPAMVVQLTINTVAKGATHWSCRSMAAQVGVSRPRAARVARASSLSAPGDHIQGVPGPASVESILAKLGSCNAHY